MPLPTLAAAAQDTLHEEFVTVAMFLLFGCGFVVLNMLVIGRLLRSRTKYTEGKATPYECGEPTFGSAFIRFDVRFYVLMLVFLVFDVEVLFLFPWAQVLKPLGALAFVEALVFVLILAVGLAYVWRKGDIDWIPQHGHKTQGARMPAGVAAATREEAPAPAEV